MTQFYYSIILVELLFNRLVLLTIFMLKFYALGLKPEILILYSLILIILIINRKSSGNNSKTN
jgi:hypothetical protein